MPGEQAPPRRVVPGMLHVQYITVHHCGLFHCISLQHRLNWVTEAASTARPGCQLPYGTGPWCNDAASVRTHGTNP
jgi:hypothetical protein